MSAYATVDQDGFYNYALFHILLDGTIQFAFQPMLDSIAVTAPQPTLKIGARAGASPLTGNRDD